jgi:hypothetical protein
MLAERAEHPDPLELILVERPALYFGSAPSIDMLQGFLTGVMIAPGLSKRDRDVLQTLPTYARCRIFGYNRNASWIPALLSLVGPNEQVFIYTLQFIREIRYGLERYGIKKFYKIIETDIEDFVKQLPDGKEVPTLKRRTPNKAL